MQSREEPAIDYSGREISSYNQGGLFSSRLTHDVHLQNTGFNFDDSDVMMTSYPYRGDLYDTVADVSGNFTPDTVTMLDNTPSPNDFDVVNSMFNWTTN